MNNLQGPEYVHSCTFNPGQALGDSTHGRLVRKKISFIYKNDGVHYDYKLSSNNENFSKSMNNRKNKFEFHSNLKLISGT